MYSKESEYMYGVSDVILTYVDFACRHIVNHKLSRN